MSTKFVGHIFGFNIYEDEECSPDEIIIYNYGRIYVHGGNLDVTNPGRVVLKLSSPATGKSINADASDVARNNKD